MTKRLITIALLLGLAAQLPLFAADAAVHDLMALVRTAIAAHQPDSQLAKTLSKLKLSDSLDSRVIEQLESEGAGPLAVTELNELAEISAAKPKPFPAIVFNDPPQPSMDGMQAVITAARTYALHYALTLPNFLCTQTVRRFEDRGPRGFWNEKDTLTLQLSYVDRAEEYKLVKVNNRPTTQSYLTMGGAVSEGEFGSMMFALLSPRAEAKIYWSHWTRLRGQLTQVYRYSVDAEHSSYSLQFGMGAQHASVIAAAKGLVYVDPESHAVMRLVRQATELSPYFPIVLAVTVLDYDKADVGGKPYLLPLHARIRLDARQLHTRNEVDFTGYHKFGGESTISFGDPVDPIKH